MTNENDELRQLTTLQRWRTAELESAQAEHVALARSADDNQSAVAKVEDDIEQSQTFTRERMAAGATLSLETLRTGVSFSLMQANELEAARDALHESLTRADAAQAVVMRRYEDLSVVERLQERRQEHAVREELRRAQNQLDSQALTRLAADGDRTLATENGD